MCGFVGHERIDDDVRRGERPGVGAGPRRDLERFVPGGGGEPGDGLERFARQARGEEPELHHCTSTQKPPDCGRSQRGRHEVHRSAAVVEGGQPFG